MLVRERLELALQNARAAGLAEALEIACVS